MANEQENKEELPIQHRKLVDKWITQMDNMGFTPDDMINVIRMAREKYTAMIEERNKPKSVNIKMIEDGYNKLFLMPDYVMIHTSNRQNIESEAQMIAGYVLPPQEKQRLFGVKVIWTDSIGVGDCIFARKG